MYLNQSPHLISPSLYIIFSKELEEYFGHEDIIYSSVQSLKAIEVNSKLKNIFISFDIAKLLIIFPPDYFQLVSDIY